ncbi:MAG: hypothetical protein Q4E35_10095 [Eubacteriales bacterium]|nr:hypothetical protein [Eubacteriales bacterium]
MNICNVKVRLNLDKPEHRAAYEILKASEKSMSQFVIAAVNAYGGYLTKEGEKELFLRQVSDTVRTTLGEMLGVSLSATKTVDVPTDIAEESGEIADDFLQNF